jgi:ketosteroid isomerase-like protein
MGQARDTAERFYELYSKGDLDGAEELFSPDCVTEAPTGSMKLDEWRAYGQTFKDALPDARMEADSVIESGNRVAVEARFVGTHEGPLATPRGRSPRAAMRSTYPSATSSPWRMG